MHIAIDTTPLYDANKYRGVGTYTKLLTFALEKYIHNHTLEYFQAPQAIPIKADLVHYPYFDPFRLTLPLIKVKPTVVTVHDLIPIAYKDKFLPGLRGSFYWELQKRSLRGARAVITDSQASKKDLSELVGLPENKIQVIYLAPSDEFQLVTEEKLLQQVKIKYKLPEKFLLYVGDVNWNKNIQGLLNAFKIYLKRYSKSNNLALVLIGKALTEADLLEAKLIRARIHQQNLDEFIIIPGVVPQQDLACFYNLASVYIQPSFAEGFGLPLLEAMACGCPAVVSQNSSLAEIAGPSILVDPNNPDDIADGIDRIERLNKIKRNELSRKSRLWAQRFSWEKAARLTAEVYEKVLS